MRKFVAALVIYGVLASSALAQVPNAGSPMVPNAAPGTGGGGGAVSSVFGRTGAIAAQSGDYSFGLISGQAALTQLPTLGANIVLGSIVGGTPIALSQTQLTSLINPATTSLPGALPAWPNNMTTYFRGDGSYATLNVAATAGAAPLASPSFTGSVTFPITGLIQCLHASSLGVVTGTGSDCGSGGSTGSNPTATASDVAVNGSASTFLRSDGAPAIQKGSASVFGLVKVDNTTMTASAGVISAVNNGTVTSVATACGATGGPITATGTISSQILVRAATGTTDTILAADCGGRVTESNAAAVAVTLPQAVGSFTTGYFTEIVNLGAGLVTVTPTTSTVDGVASLTLAQFQSALFVSDGTNYSTARGRVPNGLFTVTGALKGSGAGVVTQAACSDLSNGTALCSTTPGTGIATALAVNVGSAGAPVINGGALGTPSSGTLTSATGLPISTGVSGLGSGVATAAANNLSAAGGLTSTIASGTSALGTGAITSATCATVVTTAATNTATTDVIDWGFNSDPHAVTGYIPATAGMLTILAYPTANNVNFLVCNNTAGSITPGAITLNWRVPR